MDNDKKRGVIFSFVFPFFLLLLSYQLVIAFYPLTVEQQAVFQFLDGKQDLSIQYTAAEISHLHDVAVVMNKVDIAFYVLGMVVAGILIYSWKRKDQLQTILRYGGIATMSLLCFLLFLLGINFNRAFTVFHQLFFPGGNWQFAADSLLIQTLPVEFFVRISVIIFVLALLLSLGLFFSQKLFSKHSS